MKVMPTYRRFGVKGSHLALWEVADTALYY